MQEIINNVLAITDSKLIKSLIVILLSLIAQKVINVLIKNTFRYTVGSNIYAKRKRDQGKRAKTLTSVASAIATLMIWIIAALIIMNIFKLDISAILVSAGFMGAALAFGAQSTIRDFVNGFFIIVENQYWIDDYVKFDTVEGRVENISIRTTVIRDDNGKLHHVPNGSIVVATNLSMGNLTAQEQLELSPKINIDAIESELAIIAKIISDSPDYSRIIKAGPTVAEIEKISKQSQVVDIKFTTSAAKRRQASNLIWKLIEQQKLPLA